MPNKGTRAPLLLVLPFRPSQRRTESEHPKMKAFAKIQNQREEIFLSATHRASCKPSVRRPVRRDMESPSRRRGSNEPPCCGALVRAPFNTQGFATRTASHLGVTNQGKHRVFLDPEKPLTHPPTALTFRAFPLPCLSAHLFRVALPHSTNTPPPPHKNSSKCCAASAPRGTTTGPRKMFRFRTRTIRRSS